MPDLLIGFLLGLALGAALMFALVVCVRAFVRAMFTTFIAPDMSLRDRFAGQAMVGFAKFTMDECINEIRRIDRKAEFFPIGHSAIAARSYALADAMLAERDKRGRATHEHAPEQAQCQHQTQE